MSISRFLGLLLIGVILGSCASSEIYASKNLKPDVSPNSGIILAEVGGIDARGSERLFKLYSSKINDCQQVQYLPYLDYDLRAAMIEPNGLRDSPSSLMQIAKITNARHIVFIDILGVSSTFNASSEIPIPYIPGTLYFEIIDLQDPSIVWGIGVESSIKGGVGTMGTNAPEAGHIMINTYSALKQNLTSESTLIEKAYAKGLKELKKELIECK